MTQSIMALADGFARDFAPMRERPSETGFWQVGNRPTLIAAFLYFDLAFMVWVLLGPLAPIIAADLGMTPAQKGLMVAVPTLAGAVLRLVNGFLVTTAAGVRI